MFFLPHLGVGGVERSTFNLASQMVVDGHDVTVLTLGEHKAEVMMLPEAVSLHRITANKVTTGLPKLIAYLRRTKPDVVISAQSYANVAAGIASIIARYKGVLILTERLVVSARSGPRPTLKDRMIHWMMKRVYKRALSVVGNSQAVVDDLVGNFGLPSESCKVIYNACDFDVVRSNGGYNTGSNARSDRKIFKLVTVGRLAPQKDLATLLTAFARVAKEIDAELHLIGDGPCGSRLRLQAEALQISSKVIFNGTLENPYEIMMASHAFVLASIYEGLPNVLIEALALDLPVISTDSPGGSREVLMDGKAGLLVPTGDPQAMADAILEVANSYDAAIARSEYGRSTLGRFESKQIANQYSDLMGNY